jgi:tripartite-type tricarboxylate transporter receptor subunit TctC
MKTAQAATKHRSRPRGYSKRPYSDRHPRRKFLHLATGAVALPAVSRIARAQTYPSRPITMIVPFPAGGGTDTVGRIVAERMRVSLGQPIVIENVTGANGSIGTGRVARAAPDGYTLIEGVWNTHVANGALYSLQYDALKDFEPIALISSFPYLIVANKTIPASDLKGLITWLKANPGKATEATIGAGSVQHVGGVLLQKMIGTRFQFVPYRGIAPAMQDLLAGHVDWTFATPDISLPHWPSGNIKIYAATTKMRFASAPDIPTADEAGLPGFYLSTWQGIWAPKGTPQSVIARLNAAVVDTLADQMVRGRLADLGGEIFPRDQQTPEALAAYQKAEIEKWWPIFKEAGIKAQ